MTDTTEVKIARLEGRVDQHTHAVAERFVRLERDVAETMTRATSAHTRIDRESAVIRDAWSEEVKALREALTDLTVWRARVVGFAVGLTAMSGLLSGLIVALVTSQVR